MGLQERGVRLQLANRNAGESPFTRRLKLASEEWGGSNFQRDLDPREMWMLHRWGQDHPNVGGPDDGKSEYGEVW